MTILDRYIVSRLLSTLAKIVLTLAGLYILIDLLVTRQNNIIRYEIPLRFVAEYYFVQLPVILFTYHAVALGLLIAALMVLGKAAQDQEITAALAGGISLRRLALGPLIAGLLVAVLSFGLQESWGVYAAKRAQALDDQYFTRSGGVGFRDSRSWTGLSDGWTCHILKFNPVALTGEDVYLHRFDGAMVEDIRAERIFWDPAQEQWLLENGRHFSFDRGRAWEQRVARITQAPAPFSEPPEALFVLDQPASAKDAAELYRDLTWAASFGMPTGRHWVDFHAKFARPALCFVMVLLAVPFALRLRRGGLAVSFGAAIALGLAYMMVFFAGVGLGWMGTLPPALAAWLANGLFLLGGGWLFLRTPT